MASLRRSRPTLVWPMLATLAGAPLLLAMLAAFLVSGQELQALASCAPTPGPHPIALGPPGLGVTVGATEYGGPGDRTSGVIGSSGANLLAEPDSYAELGGDTFQKAAELGGLPYGTPLRITWGRHSVIAYKRDIGLGGGPIDGHPRAIDLWWELAERLRIPYEHGMWSGTVRLERVKAAAVASVTCSASLAGPPVVPGSRARLLADGLAAAPADAPPAVKAMIAAGNQIVGKPYVYGGGHDLPLSDIAPSYDCSSSVDHILYGARLLGVDDTWTSGDLERFGDAGLGRWVTIYANAGHVFMYVAGLRWDTWNAAGPADGTTGIGWHPLVREAVGFVARHPASL